MCPHQKPADGGGWGVTVEGGALRRGGDRADGAKVDGARLDSSCEARAVPGLSDEAELVSTARCKILFFFSTSVATDRLMSPAVKGGGMISSPRPVRKGLPRRTLQ
ncbi:unnamed protein product [Ectocarpus fasciculatus]